jgi:hypothetical protein
MLPAVKGYGKIKKIPLTLPSPSPGGGKNSLLLRNMRKLLGRVNRATDPAWKRNHPSLFSRSQVEKKIFTLTRQPDGSFHGLITHPYSGANRFGACMRRHVGPPLVGVPVPRPAFDERRPYDIANQVHARN